ncbi:MAG: hypothetical protein R3C58_07245 [Parvularculaceae bacterium]
MAPMFSTISHAFVRRVCLIFISLALAACVFDSRSMPIDGPYILIWIDTTDSTGISYDLGDGASIGRVPGRVIAYGANENFITAQREGYGYYYIDRASDHKYAEPSKVVFGPFERDRFEALTRELELPPLHEVPQGY